jgi:hypothetical protein
VERLKPTWRGAALPPLALALLLVSGCGGSPPPQLADGTAPAAVPAPLADTVEHATLTHVHVIGSAATASVAAHACLDRLPPPSHLQSVLVERVGLNGSSITFRITAPPTIYACDHISDAAGEAQGKPWCGGAAGLLQGGRLRDPRLDVLCTDKHGQTVAFAWVVPLPKARWIVVRDGSRPEIYPVAAGLPVRVTTTHDVFQKDALALFHVSQYAADGRRLTSGTIEARVAG